MPHVITWRNALILSAALHLMLLPGIASLSPKNMPAEEKNFVELELQDYTEPATNQENSSYIPATNSGSLSRQSPSLTHTMPTGTDGEYTPIRSTAGEGATFSSSAASSTIAMNTGGNASLSDGLNEAAPSYSPAPTPSAAVQSVTLPPKAKRVFKPAYPEQARREGLEGTVSIIYEVLTDGRVGSIEIAKSSGYQVLDDAAVQTVQQWRFEPARDSLSGQAVEYMKGVTLNFDLNN